MPAAPTAADPGAAVLATLAAGAEQGQAVGQGSGAPAGPAGTETLGAATMVLSQPGHAAAVLPPPASGPAAAAAAAHVAAQIAARLPETGEPARVELRLDPPELGRVTLTLTQGADASLSAQILVERPETLELLRRHSEILLRDLAAAGFAGSEVSLGLGDRTGAQNGGQTGEGPVAGAQGGPARGEDRDEVEAAGLRLPPDPGRWARPRAGAGLDILL